MKTFFDADQDVTENFEKVVKFFEKVLNNLLLIRLAQIMFCSTGYRGHKAYLSKMLEAALTVRSLEC